MAEVSVAEVAVARRLRVVLGDEGIPGALPVSARTVWPCAAGAVIARIEEGAAEESAGARRWCIAAEAVSLGKNVEWNATQTELLATCDGHIVVRGTTISVADELELGDDVDAAGGPVHFKGPVRLRKNVLDSAVLEICGDVTVDGSIEAAKVSVEGNLAVHHGICGKQRGRVEATGNVQARFASNARIVAKGDVTIGNEVANSKVTCDGRFLGQRAAVISSHVVAGQGIVCESAGTPAGIRSVLETGLDPEETAHVANMIKQLVTLDKKARDIRSAVEPLMKNPKALSAQQKEKATELLYLADEADAAARSLEASLQAPRQRIESAGDSHIEIGATAHAGVVVRCLGYETTLTTALRGPMRLALRTVGGEAVIAVLDMRNHQVAALPTVRTQAGEVLGQLRRHGSEGEARQ